MDQLFKEMRNMRIQFQDIKNQMKETKIQLEDTKIPLKDTKVQLEDAKIQLKDTKIQLEDTKIQLKDTKIQLEETKIQLEDTKIQLEDAKIQLKDTKVQLEDNKTMLEYSNTKISKLEEKLVDIELTQALCKNCNGLTFCLNGQVVRNTPGHRTKIRAIKNVIYKDRTGRQVQVPANDTGVVGVNRNPTYGPVVRWNKSGAQYCHDFTGFVYCCN